MANVDGVKGYAVVSWRDAEPESRDITGHGPMQDVPFESVQDAKDYLFELGYQPHSGIATAVVVALVEVAVVE